jgi:hypothetical protein
VFVAQEELGAKIAGRLRERPGGEDAWSALRQSLEPIIAVYRESPTQSLARLRLTRSTTKLRAHQLERFDQWKQLIGAALAERLGVAEVDVRVEALVAAALASLNAASTRWAASDGADDLIELIDEAFGAIAGPFPELRG